MSNTKVKEIVTFWSQYKSEIYLSIDWSEAHERCWRCGYKSALQRCHIVPNSLGGEDTPSNLVLLCGRCHREAPNIADPKYMWIWLEAYRTSLYDTFWTNRGIEEFEKMFGHKPFDKINEDIVSIERLRSLINKAMESTIIHFGEGRLNPSTIACILHQVENTLFDDSKKIDNN